MEQEELGQLLRGHLFLGDLIWLPRPEEGVPGFLPEWYAGDLPALVYPPLSEQAGEGDENVQLEVTPYHFYYGALRALAETADGDTAASLKRLVLQWHDQAALEVLQLAREQTEVDLNAALDHYELAIELDPDLYEAHQEAGMCQAALAESPGEDPEERLASAEELFTRAIELRPNEGFSWWSRARVVEASGRGPEAERLLRQFLQEHPEGEQREIVEHALEHGFEAEGSEEQAIFDEAQALAFGTDPGAAVEMLQPMAETYPQAGEIWFVLGAAHRRADNPAEAERCLRRAVRLLPDFPFAWWELSMACAAAKEWREAEEAVRKALELDPDNAIYLCDLGRYLLKQGNREDAEEAIYRARDLVPDDPDVQKALQELEGAGR